MGLEALASAAGTALLQRTYLLQTQTQTGIPRLLVVLDTVSNEEPEFSADVTKHPVEQGPEVGDHRQKKNTTLSLKGKISNTPLDLSVSIGNVLASGISLITSAQARSNILNTGLQQAAGVVGGQLLKGSSDPLSAGLAGAADAMARTIMLQAFDLGTPFDVVTKRQRYTNMVITRLRFPRDNSTGYALAYEIEMEEVKIVTPLKVQISQLDQSVISSASPSTNMGGQVTKQLSGQASSQISGSWLRQIVKGA